MKYGGRCKSELNNLIVISPFLEGDYYLGGKLKNKFEWLSFEKLKTRFKIILKY